MQLRVARLRVRNHEAERARGIAAFGGGGDEADQERHGRRPDVAPAVGRGDEVGGVAEALAQAGEHEAELVRAIGLAVLIAIDAVDGFLGLEVRERAADRAGQPPAEADPVGLDRHLLLLETEAFDQGQGSRCSASGANGTVAITQAPAASPGMKPQAL